MNQTQYAVKIGSKILPERYTDPSIAEQKKVKLLEAGATSLPITVVPVSEIGQEFLFE